MTVLDILQLVWLGALVVILLAAAFSVGWMAGYIHGREAMRRRMIDSIDRHVKQSVRRFKP